MSVDELRRNEAAGPLSYPFQPFRFRPIADIKKNCHVMPMEIAVKAQKLLQIGLEGSVG
jgi:hypothetical protein